MRRTTFGARGFFPHRERALSRALVGGIRGDLEPKSLAHPTITKRCCHCENDLPLHAFHRMSKAPDGLQYICKLCHGAFYSKKARRIRQLAALEARYHIAPAFLRWLMSDPPDLPREALAA